jgi:hypothetical protein
MPTSLKLPTMLLRSPPCNSSRVRVEGSHSAFSMIGSLSVAVASCYRQVYVFDVSTVVVWEEVDER